MVKGNKFWMNRFKHGRDKLFESPDDLWKRACEYFDWCIANPMIKVDFKGANVKRVNIPMDRPFTLSGLCLYLGCSSSYFRQFKSAERVNGDDFVTVITAIEETIFTQQFEGATVGAFNANIIARNLGLTEKMDHTTKGESLNAKPDLSKLSDEELRIRAAIDRKSLTP